MHQTLLFLLIVLFIQHQNAKIVVSKKDYVSMPDLFHLDNFERCMLYEDRALYCKFSFQLAPLDAQNTTKVWNTIKKVSAEGTNYRHDLLRHGVCIPDSCPNIQALLTEPDKLKSGLNECYQAKYGHLGLTGHITDMHCLNNKRQYPIGAGHWIFLVIFGLYAALFVFSSGYEGVARYSKTKDEYQKMEASKWGKIVCAFSITRNWIRLNTIDESNKDVQYFRFIQGIRFYNIVIVIFSHTAAVNLAIPVSNTIFTETLADNPFTVFLGAGGLAMQTAFIMSGSLLTYGLLKTYEDKKAIPLSLIPYALFQRFLRLSPVLILVIALKSTWLVHMNNGPLWDQIMGKDYRRCSDHGWINLLYLNNIIYRNEMCMPHTWYLACDTQFFLLTFLLMVYIKGNEKRIYGVVAAIVSFSIALTFCILYFNQYEHVLPVTAEFMYDMNIADSEAWNVTLASTYINLTGMVGGLALGFVLYKTRNKQLFKTKSSVFWWWIVTWVFGLSITLVPGMITYSPGYEPNWFYNALYGSVSKVFFIIAMSTGFVGFAHGVGWCFLWTLNWPPMYILGRLTYSAFIIHETNQRIKAAMKRELTYLSDWSIFVETVGDICVAFLLALVLHLVVELPMSQLLKLATPQKKELMAADDDVKKKM